jgi:hypothetical protein
MSTPIYKIWKTRPNAAWFDLNEQEQNDLLGQNTSLFAELGGKSILTCRSFWSVERYILFGIELFPNAQALQKHSDKLEDLGWPKLLDSESLLGIAENPFTPVEGDTSKGVFKMYIGSFTSGFYLTDEKARNRALEQLGAAAKENGVKTIIQGNIISSERFDFFGAEYYPSLDAVATYRKCLNEMNWFQYISADILLGIPLS